MYGYIYSNILLKLISRKFSIQTKYLVEKRFTDTKKKTHTHLHPNEHTFTNQIHSLSFRKFISKTFIFYINDTNNFIILNLNSEFHSKLFSFFFFIPYTVLVLVHVWVLSGWYLQNGYIESLSVRKIIY